MGGGRLHVSKEKLEEKRKGADTPFYTRLYGASYPNQSKSRPYVLSILNENYNFYSIWTFFGVHMDPGSKIKRSQLRLAPLSQKPHINVYLLVKQFR